MNLFLKGLIVALVFSVIMGGLLGCGPDLASRETITKLPPAWRPTDVRLNCPSGDCPEGVGLLVFVDEMASGYEASRCTASLIARNQILTNDHCGEDLLEYDGAYFFLNTSSNVGDTVAVAREHQVPQTVIYPVGPKLESRRGLRSGPNRDLAIYDLTRPVEGIAPLKIAREIPADMRVMSAFVINAPGREFTSFIIDKLQCGTMQSMPIYGGGVKDEAAGLGLFECKVRQGHSGAPVFAGSNPHQIQAIVNTVWPFGSAEGQEAREWINKIHSLFYDPPEIFARDYAMAERIQCLELPGFPAPARPCQERDAESALAQPLREAARELIRQWHQGFDSDDELVWSLQLSAGEDGVRKFPILTFKTVPFCRRASASPRRSSAVHEGGWESQIFRLRLGFGSDGKIHSMVLSRGGRSLSLESGPELAQCGPHARENAMAASFRDVAALFSDLARDRF